MEAWLAGMFIFMASGFSAIWYRLGRMEGRCKSVCDRVLRLNGCGTNIKTDKGGK